MTRQVTKDALSALTTCSGDSSVSSAHVWAGQGGNAFDLTCCTTNFRLHLLLIFRNVSHAMSCKARIVLG